MMLFRALVLQTVLAGMALLAAATSPTARADALGGLIVGGDRLTAGREPWRNESVFFERRETDGKIWGLRANATRRFDLQDYQLEGFYSQPLSDKLRLGIDVNASPTHRVLAQHGFGGNLQYEFARAWLVNGGVRQTDYDAVSVKQLSLGAEHYFGDWGAALTLYHSHAYGENNQTYVGRLSRYYGDRDRINLLLASGREPTSLGGTVINSDVLSLTLTGRHWMSPRWAIDYTAGVTRQGEFYTRRGGSIGLVVAF